MNSSNGGVLSIPLLEVPTERRQSNLSNQVAAVPVTSAVALVVPEQPAPHPAAITTVVPTNNMCRFVWLMIIAGLDPMYVGYLLFIGWMASY